MPSIALIASTIRREGQPVTLVRQNGAPVCVQGFVRGYSAAELVNDIQQGDREVRIAPEDLIAAGFPGAPRKLDRLTIGPAAAVVQSCETRMLRGVPAMHILQVRGG